MCLLARLLRRVAPRFSCPGLFVCLVLARARCGIAGGSTRLLAVITRVPPRLAVRCALFSVFVGVGRFSGVNKIGRLFGGASLWGFALGLRLRASPSGFAFGLRLRARPNPRLDSKTHGRCSGSFPNSPQNTHGKPRSFLRQNMAVRRTSTHQTPAAQPPVAAVKSPPPPPPPSPPPPPAETFTAALLNRKFNWALLFKKKKPHSRRPKVLAKN